MPGEASDGLVQLIASGSPWAVALGVAICVVKYLPDLLKKRENVEAKDDQRADRERLLFEREESTANRQEQALQQAYERVDQERKRADDEQARGDRWRRAAHWRDAKLHAFAHDWRNEQGRVVLWGLAIKKIMMTLTPLNVDETIKKYQDLPDPKLVEVAELPPLIEEEDERDRVAT